MMSDFTRHFIYWNIF